MKKPMFGRRATLAACGLGIGSLLASSAVAAPRAAAPPVKQPRIVQIVPDADGLPWQMEIRPSVKVAQSDEAAAEEIPAIPEDRIDDGASRSTANDATPAITPKSRAKKREQGVERNRKSGANGQQQSRPVQAMPDAFIGSPEQISDPPPQSSPSKPVPPPTDPGQPMSEPMVQTAPAAPQSAPQAGPSGALPIAADASQPSGSIGAAYREAYRAIPFNPRLEASRPGYRHELAVLLLTGKQLPPVTTPQHLPVTAPAGLGVPPSQFAPYRPYLPAQYDYYQAQPSQFRLLNPGLFAPGFNGTINSPFVSPLGY